MGFENMSVWSNFLQYSDEKIKEEACRKANKEDTEFQGIYAWFYGRLDDERKVKFTPPTHAPVGPPAEWVPFLTVSPNGHVKDCIGLLAVDEKPTHGAPNHGGEWEKHSWNAADCVFDLFRSLHHRLGAPKIRIEHDLDGGGSSLSLAAMMAALGRVLGVEWPDKLISTGCMGKDKNGKPILATVGKETLPNKIKLAQRFGYKRLVVVEGQEGFPEDHSMEIIPVSTDPLRAVLDLLKHASGVEKIGLQIAQLLAEYDRRMYRSNKLPDVETLTEPFLKYHSPQVNHIIYDMRSRAALHDGETGAADKHRKQAEENALAWHEYPRGWLGHYLRYEQVASRAELAVDQAIWEDADVAHKALDHRLTHLENAKNAGFADASDYFAILALRNTRAQRKQFLGRLRQELSLLESAWEDFTFLQDDWLNVHNHCKEIGREDSTPQRQRNYCLSLLADFRHMKANEDIIAEFIRPLDEKTFVRNDAYDEVAWLDWQYLLRRQPGEDEIAQCMAKADECFASWKKHPSYIPYEKILRYDFGTPQQRAWAKEQIAKALPFLEEDKNSILSVLALRARVLIGKLDELSPELPQGTPLKRLAGELLRDPDALAKRCPY